MHATRVQNVIQYTRTQQPHTLESYQCTSRALLAPAATRPHLHRRWLQETAAITLQLLPLRMRALQLLQLLRHVTAVASAAVAAGSACCTWPLLHYRSGMASKL